MSDAIDEQANARLPGTKRLQPDEVNIDSALWKLAQSLAKRTP